MPCRRVGPCPVSRSTKHHNLAAIVTISPVSTIVRSEVRRGHQGDKGAGRRLAQDLLDGLGRSDPHDAERMAHNLRTGGIRARKIPARNPPRLFIDVPQSPAALSLPQTGDVRNGRRTANIPAER